MCRGFAQHLELFRDASQLYAEELENSQHAMAMRTEVRERIREKLSQADL